MRNFSERLLEYLNYKGLSANKFEQAAKLSSGTAQKILKNKTGTGSDNIEKIFRAYPDLNIHWLITGEGSMLLSHESGKKSNEMSVQLSAHSSAHSDLSDKTDLVKITHTERTHIINEKGTKLIPIVDINMAAGDGYINPSYIETTAVLHFPSFLLKPGFHLAAYVKGESMAPTLKDGDIAVLRRLDKGDWANIADKRVCAVVDTDGGVRIKRIKNRLKRQGFIVLMSDNPDKASFPNVYLPHHEIVGLWDVEPNISFKLLNIHDQYYAKLQTMEDRQDELDRKQHDIEELMKKVLKS